MTQHHNEDSLADRAKKILSSIELDKKKDAIEETESLSHRLKNSEFAKKIASAFNTASEALKSAAEYAGPVGRAAISLGKGIKSVAEFAMFERENGVYKRDEDGDRIFSGKRLAASFAVAAALGLSATLGAQYNYYHSTQFNELVYTTGKQEINKGELYHITGCTSLPCSTVSDNGKYYQVEKSLYWPRQIYPEENVYANVPQQIAACDIHGYGIYFKQLKWAFKWAEWYQKIESVSCRPLSEMEIQKMMDPANGAQLSPAAPQAISAQQPGITYAFK